MHVQNPEKFEVIQFPGSTRPQNAEPTFWERWRTRRYVGDYNSFMRDGGCMSSRSEHIRFTPAEEQRFCQAVLRATENPENWERDGYVATHKPSGISIWTTNGRHWVRVWRPHEIPLRSGTQKKIWNALHAMRHRTTSPEALALISKLELAA